MALWIKSEQQIQSGVALRLPPHSKLVRQVRLELTIPCLRGRCLHPVWLLTHELWEWLNVNYAITVSRC